MISDFKAFSIPHLIGLITPIFIGGLFVFVGLNVSDEKRRKLNVLLAFLLIAIRGSRYVMDVFYNRFEIFDLFSLHICHIDLILLIICLIKPSKTLFHFVFLIGIPMGLAVALMPGSEHPAPGLPRAIMFIMSHTMLVVGALYLAVVEKIDLKLKYVLSILGIANLLIFPLYLLNKQLNTNFLYLVQAPPGTVIEKLAVIFGWPGYVLAMDIIAMCIILLLYFVHKMIFQLSRRKGRRIQLTNAGMI